MVFPPFSECRRGRPITPVRVLPLPGRAAGNCVGQHRILLKGCNAKHGFYVFKYVYSFSTRRNQTQIEKEEAKSQSTGPSRQSGEDDARWGLTEDGAAPERGDDGGTDAMENRTVLKTENHSTPGISGDARGPRPGTSTWAHSGIGVVGPTPASSEGSGNLDFVVEVNGDGGVSILPQGGHPSEAVTGNRSGGAEDEGSGEATVLSQGQEDAMQRMGMGGTAFTSVTEKMEDVQVDTKGVDEYAYIPDSGRVTITQGKVGSTAGGTSFTQISPDADEEVNIFIGRANIHVGEQETTLAGATVGSKDDSIPTAGTSSSMPSLGVAAAHDGDHDDGIPARRQPEGPTTTATTSHGNSVTSSPGGSHPTEDGEDGGTTIRDRAGLVASGPWRVAGGDVTVPAGAGGHGYDDKEKR
ncbi:PREDICTED: matrix extracellular phosphoglycoprotein, partial [Chlamydotis macqueenii]|uniref:matrix extracellular phosphoglycoprotein n=1 Tax=Chlamydotis macqueenii TaxID=187382 RepID=UPI000529BFC0